MSPLVFHQESCVVSGGSRAGAGVEDGVAPSVRRVVEHAVAVKTHVAAVRAETECAQLYLAEARHNLRARKIPQPII